jgi:hypothetical protein
MSSTTTFTVKYDGEALHNNQMDVRELAPALLAIGQLFDEANRVLNENKTTVNLQVKATSAGSFEISFLLQQSFLNQITAVLQGDTIQNAVTIFDLCMAGGTVTIGLFGLIKKLRGQKPNRITEVDNQHVKIEFDHESFIVPLSLLRLYQDLGVRHAVEKILKPLHNNDIDTFEVKESFCKVDKKELPYFNAPAFEDRLILEDVRQVAYSIVSLSFKEENKWRLYDGNSTINASIKDETFLEKVETGLISFTKGDFLICRVKITQNQTETGLKTDYEIQEVVEHRPSPKQLNLSIEPEDPKP